MKKRKLNLLPIAFLLAMYILCIYINYRYSKTIIDSDMASELILANLLNKTGGIVTSKWTYTTEVRVFSFQILNRIGLNLFPNNWMNARTFTQGILMFLYALSFIFFSYCIGLKKKGIYIASILLMPLGFWYTFHNYFGGFYIVHTIYLLVLSGLVLNVLRKHSLNVPQFIFIFIFSIICGVNGIKIILYFSIPCIFVATVFLLCKILSSNFKHETMLELDEFKFFVATLIATLGTLIGFAIYNIICKKIGFVSSIYYIWNDFNINDFLSTLSFYLKNFGYPSNEYFEMRVEINSLVNIFGVGGIATILILISAIVYLIVNIKKISKFDRYLFIYAISTIAIVCLIMTCIYSETTGNNGSYTLPLVPLGFVIIELAINNLKITDITKNLVRLTIIILAGLSSITNLNWFISYHPRRNSNLDYAISFIEDNNINNIYASFWNSNVITALTNGKITTYTFIDKHFLDVYQYGRIIDNAYPNEEPVYVLLEEEFNPGTSYEKDGVENIYSFQGYSIIKAKDITTYTNNSY